MYHNLDMEVLEEEQPELIAPPNIEEVLAEPIPIEELKSIEIT
jgi:hypothetical protein